MSKDQNFCKICHSPESEKEPLCYPCKCSGTIKYIHKDCLFLYINSSKRNYCTICKHEYVFKDIYKPGAPEKLPLRIVLQGLYSTLSSIALKFLKQVLGILFFTSIFATNGSIMVALFVKISYPFFSLQNFLWTLFIGALVTPISYLHFHLYKSLGEALRRMSNRRSIRIDSMNVMSSIASDAMSVTEMGSDVQARSILSHVSSNVNFRNQNSGDVVFNTESHETGTEEFSGEMSQIPDINNTDIQSERTYQITNHSSEDSNVSLTYAPDEDGFAGIEFSIDYKLYLKCVGAMIFFYIFMSFCDILKFEYFNLPYFCFLKRIYVYEISKKFLVFYIFLILSTVCVNYLFDRYKNRTLKQIRAYLSIYYSVFFGFTFLVFVLGTGVHYYFMLYINQQEVLLKLNNSFFNEYRSYISLFFHLAIGFSINHCFRNLIEMFKNRFRQGLLYFIAEPERSDIFFFCRISDREIIKNTIKSIINSAKILLLWRVTFYTLSYFIEDIKFIFRIESVTKLLFLFKLLKLVSNSFNQFHDFLSWLSILVIKPISKIFGLSNFLFNDVLVVDKANLSNFVWHPNKHRYFSSKKVIKRRERKVTSEDVEKYFNKNMNTNYSIFYAPRFYRLACLVVMGVIFSIYLLSYVALFYYTNRIVRYIGISRFFENVDDLMFIIISASILKLFTVFWSLRNVFFSLSALFLDFRITLKYQIIFIFSNVIFPLWGTFMLVFLYSDFTLENMMSPGVTFIILFSSNYVIIYVMNKFIFRRSLRTYSFISIFKKLYGFMAFITSLFFFIAFLKSFAYMNCFNPFKTPFISLLCVSYVLFYFRIFFYRKYLDFYSDLKKQHYLLDREVINHENL